MNNKIFVSLLNLLNTISSVNLRQSYNFFLRYRITLTFF